MELVGSVASTAQILECACKIASIIRDVRTALKTGPTILREQSQQLDFLNYVVENIRLNRKGQSDRVFAYLALVQDKILRLHDIILHRLGRLTSTGFRRFKAALTFTGRNKEVVDSFAALRSDCETLLLFMSSTTSGPMGRSGGVQRSKTAANPSRKVSDVSGVSGVGEFPVTIIPRTTPTGLTWTNYSSEGPKPAPPPQRDEATPRHANVPKGINQDFSGMKLSGSDTRAGNYGHDAGVHGLNQSFKDLDGTNARTVLGNVVYPSVQGQDSGGKAQEGKSDGQGNQKTD